MFKETPLYELLQRMRKLNEVEAWIFCFKDGELKQQIIEWIRDSQLRDKGIDETGTVIGYYKYGSEIGEPYDLNDTGAFVRSITVTVFREFIEINADGDVGKKQLFKKFGDGIIGLTDEHLDMLADMITDKLIDYAESIIFN